MKYYPILLGLKAKKCVVIGGGKVAERKITALLKAQASVWVVSPKVTSLIKKLKEKKVISIIYSGYQAKSLKGAFLVVVATNDQKINQRIAGDAKSAGLLINVVDDPALSNFIVPSVIRKKGLIISISTSGQAPILSKRMRKDISRLLVPEYAKFLTMVNKIRANLKKQCASPKLRAALLENYTNFHESNAKLPRINLG